jgi:uncharacterized protein DUF4129
VIRRRIVPLALVVTALLAVVAIAAHGRPLGSHGGRGSGLPAGFWDYVFTTFVIFDCFLLLAGLVALYYFRKEPDPRSSFYARTTRALVVFLAIAAALTIIGTHLRLHPLNPPPVKNPKSAGKEAGRHAQAQGPRHSQVRWDEVAIVLGVVLAFALVGASTARRRLRLQTRGKPDREALAAALDESLDDLRADPDLRRAIIAAYARMETALGAAGLARRPSEAPLEYLERALLALDASADAVRRLTDLFVWARFSHHEPEPSMRDEAVDALVAVRDELRASELAPA